MKFHAKIILLAVQLMVIGCVTQPKPFELGNAVEIDNPYGFSYKADQQDQNEYDIIAELGSSWIRTDFFWDILEPASGEWNFDVYDSFIETCSRNDQKILALLLYDTPWIREIESEKRRVFYIAPDKIPDYLNYVRRIVERYDDKIAAYEIWNEPNGFFWDGTDEEYFELQKQTAALIREINPEAVIMCAGLFLGDTNYIKKMFRYGAMENIDILAMHPYAVNPEGSYRQMANVMRTAESLGFDGEYWITEVGSPTGGLKPIMISPDRHASAVLKTHCYLLSLDIPVIIWYTIFDKNPVPGDDQFGLVVKPGFEWKQGAYAYRLLGEFVRNGSLRNDLLQATGKIERNVMAYHFINEENQGVLILWAKNHNLELSVDFPSSNVIEYDIYSTDSRTANSEMTIVLTEEPRFFTYQANEESMTVLLEE